MQVISTPPKPAAPYDSRQRVRFASFTAEPCHHQRVHGRAVWVIGGHSAAEFAPAGCADGLSAAISSRPQAVSIAMLRIASVRTRYLRRSTTGAIAASKSNHVAGSGTPAPPRFDPAPCVAPKLPRHVL